MSMNKGEAMKKLRFLTAFVLASIMVFSLAGCSGKEGTEPSGREEQKTEPSESEEVKELVYPEKTDGKFTMKALEDWMKINGRTYFTGSDGAMLFDWSDSGFSVNLETEGTDFKIFLNTTYAMYISVYMDGEEIARPKAEITDEFVTVAIPAGTHEITVYKDTEIKPDGAANLLGIDFEGTLLPPPEKKKLYIDFYGASYETAQGALGTYTPGEAWSLEDHSGTHSYCKVLADKLDADFSIVAKGGIGALAQSGGQALPDLFVYVNGYRDQNVKYDFKRKPDLIIVQLGGNDSSSDLNGYGAACENFLRTLRAAYGNEIPIIWMGRNAAKRAEVENAAKRTADENFYYVYYEVEGKGSAALTTQTKGHPSAEEHIGIAEQVYGFITENNLTEK